MSEQNNGGPVARFDWSLYVDCPGCNETFDLVDQEPENDYFLSKRIFSNAWEAVKGCEVTCPHCAHEFALGGVEY